MIVITKESLQHAFLTPLYFKKFAICKSQFTWNFHRKFRTRLKQRPASLVTLS